MNFFPTVLEAGKSRVKVQADSVSGEVPLPGLQAATFSLYPHMMEREGRGAELGTMEFGPLRVTHLWLQHLSSPVVLTRVLGLPQSIEID